VATDVPDGARALLRQALESHGAGEIERALDQARQALELAPAFADARSYLGQTLVTRRARYAEGLAELERARGDAPDDPALQYTLGWCYEFVAHAVARRGEVGFDAEELYEKAAAALRRCLELQPEGKLKDDAADLLASIIKEDVG